MTQAEAHLRAQDDLEVCDATGKINPTALLALVTGGVVFIAVLGLWMLLNRITGRYV